MLDVPRSDGKHFSRSKRTSSLGIGDVHVRLNPRSHQYLEAGRYLLTLQLLKLEVETQPCSQAPIIQFEDMGGMRHGMRMNQKRESGGSIRDEKTSNTAILINKQRPNHLQRPGLIYGLLRQTSKKHCVAAAEGFLSPLSRIRTPASQCCWSQSHFERKREGGIELASAVRAQWIQSSTTFSPHPMVGRRRRDRCGLQHEHTA